MEFTYYKGFDKYPVQRNGNEGYIESLRRMKCFKNIKQGLEGHLQHNGFRVTKLSPVGSTRDWLANKNSDLDILVTVNDPNQHAILIMEDIRPIANKWITEFRKQHPVPFSIELFYEFVQANGETKSCIDLMVSEDWFDFI